MGFAVRVWSWKLFQIKDPLVFGTAIRGYVNQNIVLRRVVWSSRSSARCFDDSTQHDVLFTEPRIAAPNTNRSLIRNNFQDQTSTATVGISLKNMGKMPQNLLKKVFWKINFIKMIKIFVCEENLTETIGWGYNCHFYFPSFWMPWVQTISWKSSLAWKKMEQFSKHVWKENTFVRLDDR